MTGPILQPPTVSPYTRQILDEAIAFDRCLVVETGGWCLYDVQREISRASPDWIEEAVLDGLRWRHYWRPDSVLWREELEARERARVAIEVSHDLSGAMRWGSIGPSHRELAAIRATPAWVRRCVHKGCRWLTTVFDPAITVVQCPQHGGSRSEAATEETEVARC